MSIFFNDLKCCIAWCCVKRLLRLENICLAIYHEEEALQGKEKLSFLHFISWLSDKALDRSCSLSVLKIFNWKKKREKWAYFCSLVWECSIGLLFGFGFGFCGFFFFLIVVTTSLSISLQKGRGFFRKEWDLHKTTVRCCLIDYFV